jgi:hypothetical protein
MVTAFWLVISAPILSAGSVSGSGPGSLFSLGIESLPETSASFDKGALSVMLPLDEPDETRLGAIVGV